MSADYRLCHEITQFCQDWASVLLQNARQLQQSGPTRRTMKLPRRKFLQFAGAAAVAPTFLRVAKAQTYPSRPITMIVPFPAGAGYDTIGRIIAERMRDSLGQPIIIENASGANGSIGVGRAARAAPDGYTIVVGGLSVHVLNGALYSLPYDVVNDFTPISPLAESPWVLFSRKGFPANDLPGLIDWLKAHPEMASAAIQIASAHLVTASLQKQTGTRFALVPYRGSAPAMQDLVAGHIDLLFDTPLQIPLVRAGSIKAFAVTNDVRLAVAPDIPTFAEMGVPGVSYTGWFGLFAPRGTPKDIIAKLNAAAVGALADPAVRSRIADLGYDIFPHERQTPEALGALQKADAEKWWPIIKELGITAE
jgi:tripartite-type tricarboxylate transporter receptor subunit TctC